MNAAQERAGRGLSRRGLFGAAGLAGAGVLAGTGAVLAGADGRSGPGANRYPFHGAHQAGILTPAQDRLAFAAFDVTTPDRDSLTRLLREWTEAIASMTAGRPVGDGEPLGYDSPPADTGEALDLPAAGLTVTVGFGPTLFELDGQDRVGLAARRPRALRRLPHFAGDDLDPARSDGDLCVQACADDPQVAVHALRNLARIGFGTVSLRWTQLGFGRTSSTSTHQQTPRNLLGFKDGTANLKAEESAEVDRFVWVDGSDDPAAAWLAGGSYLVARRINMHIETWDRTSLREQEAVIGRQRSTGAPLSGGSEFTEPDLTLEGSDGPLIPADSHVSLAHPSRNGGTRLLRRGYNFADGSNDLGRIDAGLFFIAFVRDPGRHFVPMQQRLARVDTLSEYLQHTGSGLWAVPPGIRPGEYLGQGLFA